jgi:small-conductance mechanosensitive channel
MDIHEILATPAVTKLLSTIVFVALALGSRAYAVHLIRSRPDLSPTVRRQWIVKARNVTFFVIFGVAIVIWLEQLRTIAATIVVIAAAIVVATKEFLLNVVGFFYRTTAKFVSVVDRIEINGIRGDVIDQSLMGVAMLEIGPGEKTHHYTGRSVYIPNSQFLAATVKNETHLWSDYVFHLVTIPVDAGGDWQEAERALLRAADEVCAPYLAQAQKIMSDQALEWSLDQPSVEPRVQVQIVGPDLHHLVLRVPVPNRKRGRLEQDITRRYLELTRQESPPPA